MPRLFHNKSSQGCHRCKKRRVKCDEGKPSCGACSRHQVHCEYPQKPRNRDPITIEPSASSSGSTSQHDQMQDSFQQFNIDRSPSKSLESVGAESSLEFRLLHHYLVYTSRSFSSGIKFYSIRVPLLAYEHRFVFDGLLSMAALHLHRLAESTIAEQKTYMRQHALEKAAESPGSTEHLPIFLGHSTSEDMRQLAVEYFHRAIQGSREALERREQNGYEGYRAVFTASALISIIALFLLGVDNGVDEALWFKLGVGPREIPTQWGSAVSRNVVHELGVLDGPPDLSNDEEIFRPADAEPFRILLSWGSEYEVIDADDYLAYQQTLSYIGLLYKSIIERSEAALASSRRAIAFPSRAPRLFVKMVSQRKARAMAMMGYLFAVMKLLDIEILWFKGIAERRVPAIHEQLPAAWKGLMDWPMTIVANNVSRMDVVPLPSQTTPPSGVAS